MSYKIIKLTNAGKYEGYITYDATNRTFNEGGKKEDAVNLEQIVCPDNKDAYYYKVKDTAKEYMDVKTTDKSKIKGNKPILGKGLTAAWIMVGDKLSTFQGGLVTNRLVSSSNDGDTSNQLYANTTGEHCIVNIEDVQPNTD